MSLNTKTNKKHNQIIQMNQNHKKHTNIKGVISKPILIYMQPKYCSKATINFNYFLPNKPILLIN